MEMNTLSIDHTNPCLINELTQGRDLVKQLQQEVHLEGGSSSTAKLLVTKILSSLDKVLFMMSWEKSGEVDNNQPADQLISKGSMAVMTGSMSPHSGISGSPRSYYNSDFFGVKSSRSRRKRLPRWTEKVRVGMVTGFESSPDDGYDWRKYGQKEIQAAKYPRSYYRCTHRNVQGCQATKQVQRSDEDPSFFNITYEGSHTCTQQLDLTQPGPYSVNYEQDAVEENERQMDRKKQKKSQEIIFNFQSGSELLKPKQFDTKEFTTTLPFSDPSKLPRSYCLENENDHHIFSSLKLENNFMAGSNFSPPFGSPITSEDSNCFSSSSFPILDSPIFSLDPMEFNSQSSYFLASGYSSLL